MLQVGKRNVGSLAVAQRPGDLAKESREPRGREDDRDRRPVRPVAEGVSGARRDVKDLSRPDRNPFEIVPVESETFEFTRELHEGLGIWMAVQGSGTARGNGSAQDGRRSANFIRPCHELEGRAENIENLERLAIDQMG